MRGRPVTVAADVHIGTRLSSDTVAAIDTYASLHTITRSEALRRLIRAGLAQSDSEAPTLGEKPARA